MILNNEQQACVDAKDGIIVVRAGPGSGKTTTLVQRHLSMLTRGVQSRDILNLTFTSAAAENMVRKVGLLDSDKIFRTFHSFAMELLKKEREHLSFKLCETVIPVAMEDYQLLFDLVKAYPSIKNFRALKEAISTWKRLNVSPDDAVVGAKGVDYFMAKAYQDYETECRQQGWLDFDSLIRETASLLETNEEVRNRWKRKYISVDETQDCDVVQFRILQLIFDGNIFVVGDENQCQPPGTMVEVLVRPRSGRLPSIVKCIPIEKLKSNHKLVSWDHYSKKIRYGAGRSFKRAVRQYSGWMLEVSSDNKSTQMTPNHLVWVKFDKEVLETKESNHFVYLMWKKKLGFRLGVSRFRRSSGSNQVSHRGYQEGADKMWVLRMCKSGNEAQFFEELYSLRWGIPESSYHNRYENCKKTQKQIEEIFSEANPAGGYLCLAHHGKLFDHPLVSWDKRKKYLTKFHGYFKTAAANIIPGLMRMPTQTSYKSSLIKSVDKKQYSGPVYSLDVERDHTYIADGIPVGNCIYEWRSAQGDSLSKMSQKFPNSKSLFLGQNYRSTKRLVEFFKKILPVDNGIASHMRTDNVEGEDPRFVKYADPQEEAYWVLAQITEPTKTAVIARTNRQLFIFQRICTMRNIKYQILGKKDFWEQNEVKKLLALAKETGSQRPANEVLESLIQQHRLIDIYKNSITNDSNPVENLNDVVRMAAGKGTIADFLTYLRKRTHGRKSAKGLILSTVHQAKGREWDNVFVIGAEQGKMPHVDGELKEEHRIFFVACTRAARFLQISFSGHPSMFLNDFRDQIINNTEETI